jgi:histo-blood group ABO system transferase
VGADMKIGFIIIATSKYTDYISALIDSINKHIKIINAEINFAVFADCEQNNIPFLRVPHLPWPLVTLLRYNIITEYEQYLKNQDYLFYIDADMLVVNDIGSEILGDLVAVEHYGFYGRDKQYFTYERNEKSTAFIKEGDGEKYYAGGFLGGKTENFLSMSKTIAENVNKDLNNNIIAVWHDESHLNRYLIDNQPTIILPPMYCYPEGEGDVTKTKIISVKKNHKEIRGIA